MKQKLLIVDDDADTRVLIKASAEYSGLDVVGEAVSADDGLYQFRDKKPDLITMDMNMSGTDPVEVISMMASEKKGTRILVLTGSESKGTIMRALKAGAQRYISKPFSVERLSGVLSSMGEAPKKPAPKLGEMLVNEGVITQQQLDDALQEQTMKGTQLGQVLVQMGFIDQQQMLKYVFAQSKKTPSSLTDDLDLGIDI